jgi:protein-tyrosine-phosphatase
MSDRIKHILFVCTGNICRSPFAEGLLKKLAQKNGLDDIVSDSAGLLALPGNSATSLAQKVAAEYDVDLSRHMAK